MAPMTLTYFDFAGRAEAIRLALHIAEQEFEDKRTTYPEFKATGLHYLPALQIEGVEFYQSTALLRYAGRLAGLFAEDPLEALKVDEVVMTIEDMNSAIGGTSIIKDPAQKMEARQAAAEGPMKKALGILQAKKEANPSSKFMVGDCMTIADLLIHATNATLESGLLDGIPTSLLADNAPALKEVQAAVLEHPKVKEYYASKAK